VIANIVAPAMSNNHVLIPTLYGGFSIRKAVNGHELSLIGYICDAVSQARIALQLGAVAEMRR
jgi:hypothetical protein